MDGDPVTGESSQTEETPTTYTELFVSIFPEYLAMGMSYEEFWRGPAILALAYRKAYETKRKLDEWARWRQGAYFFAALLCAAPVMRAFGKGKVEPGKYPDEPWPMNQKEADERAEAQEKERYERYIAQMEAASERELKRRSEEAAKKEVSEDGRH